MIDNSPKAERMMKQPLRLCVTTLLILLCIGGHSSVQAELRLSGIFSDRMVLQRERPVLVWGWADKGQQVTVQFDGQTASATADGGGAWQVTLKPMKPSGEGRDLSVRINGESLVIRDVVVGDVWHASGQSNMAMTVGAVAIRLPQAREPIAAAKFPAIRFRRINENESAKPLDNLPLRGGWIVCAPETVGGFSAAAFYFARKLHTQLGVPIGVIDSSRGGTPIEPFIPRDAFQSHPTLRRELELGDQGDLRGIWKLPGGVRARDANWLPGRLFHSRLAPITRFVVRGAIWYQGESNCGDGEDPRDYQHKMRALITGWRKALGNEKMPVYFVQLPGSGARDGWPYLREQQRLSADLPNTGMAVTIDLLDGDIHPPNKIDVGERLARWALAGEYEKKIPYSGPLFERAEIADGKVTVHFAHAESGLMVATKDGLADPKEAPETKLSHFELADNTGQWHAAVAAIQGQAVIVRSEEVPNPVAVRYAYAVNPQHCNLYNRDGLPASPFCSDPTLLKYAPNLPGE
jgi:sialate O-acetylesterase